MSNTTTAAVRSSRSGMAPPGRRFASNGNFSSVSSAVASCASVSSTCCMGDAEAGLQTAYEDKYRKRLKQRKQKRLRNVLLGLLFSLCLLVFTYYQTRNDGVRVRFARKGELPRHSQQQRGHQQHGRGHKQDHSLNDDHNKDDQNENESETRKRRNKMREKLQAHERNRGRGGWFGEKNNNDDNDDGSDAEESQDEETIYQRRLLELQYLSERMESNTNTSIRWADMSDVPPLPGQTDASRNNLIFSGRAPRGAKNGNYKQGKYRQFFQIHRKESEPMAWEEEFDAIENKNPTARSNYVNYVHHKYNYPKTLMEPPTLGKYPFMRTYKELMDTWPQDNLDHPPEILQEDLMHFDFNIPGHMEAAVKFREDKLPFKVINVPEVMEATHKWTDEYLTNNFDSSSMANSKQADGKCNEGPDNFFAFFNVGLWNVAELGIPPTRDNDWTFKKWTKHSHYADRVGLHPHRPHYYWQSGVPREERFQKESQWTFVSKDLHSFSSTTDNFFLFHAEKEKGIQCRFGERGITAANHYDSGRNMIAMITGAKRYILSPPRACKRLGIVSSKGHASFRHSMLNYGHIAHMNTNKNNAHGDGDATIDNDYSDEMPKEEREWLEMAGSAEAVSTVLKEGEVLYVPTGWFHYITSLQKSAQCNVRSGPDMEGDRYWGGANDISADCFPHQ